MLEFIISDNVSLRALRYSDSQQFFDAIDTERGYFRDWLPFVDHIQSVEDVQAYIAQCLSKPAEAGELVLGIHVAQNFVGLIGFKSMDRENKKAEIGYWLSRQHQKKGIITKALYRLLKYSFEELALNRVQLKIAKGNQASIGVAKRLGFLLEGVERDGELLVSGFADLYIYSMLKREFKAADKNDPIS